MNARFIPAKPPKKKRGFFKIFAVTFSILFLTGLMVAVGAVTFVYFKYASTLPDVSKLSKYKPSLVTKLYDNNDTLIGEYYIEKRILLPLDEVPMLLRMATVAVEDTMFYEHHGINIEGIMRAMLANIKAGRVVQGGSSITQQVAKLLLLTPERTWERKIKEAILSIRIDRMFTKNQILEIYLNHIYYGHGAYGVEAAAQTYFGKHVGDLTLAEMALITSLPKAPTHYSPYNNRKKATQRRSHTLKRLVAIGAITDAQKQEADKEPYRLAGKKGTKNKAPWFAEFVRRYLEKKYGADTLYRGGLTVRTTLDLNLQKEADEAVRHGLEKNDRRLGYHGPLGHIDLDAGEKPDWKALNPKRDANGDKIDLYRPGNKIKGVVTAVEKKMAEIGFEEGKTGIIALKDMDWAHKVNTRRNARWWPKMKDATKILKRGDIVEVRLLSEAPEKDGAIPLALSQQPAIQGALLAIDPRTGYIRAMVGGYDPKTTKFNRAVQARRQPGSSFKPVIYTAALEKGFTPSSIIIDSPIIFDRAVTAFKGWKPVNFEEKFFGPTTIRNAVTHSRNIVTIKTLDKIGVGYVVDYAKRFGVMSKLEPNLSLALGSSPLTVMEMAGIYGTLANGGVYAKPMFIKTIEDRNGSIIEKNEPVTKRTISPSVAYLMTNILQNVVREGTAKNVRLGRPVAGKTGTTNNYIDAWFIGFTPDIACAVWVGRDNNKSMGNKETGSRAAVPIWSEFMKKAVEDIPIHDFDLPAEIVFERVDQKTGLLTRSTGKGHIFEAFIDGSQPTRFVGEGSASSDRFTDKRDGF